MCNLLEGEVEADREESEVAVAEEWWPVVGVKL